MVEPTIGVDAVNPDLEDLGLEVYNFHRYHWFAVKLFLYIARMILDFLPIKSSSPPSLEMVEFIFRTAESATHTFMWTACNHDRANPVLIIGVVAFQCFSYA